MNYETTIMAHTAMKQMVDYLEEMKSKTTDQSEIYMLIDAWVHAIHLMKLEKEQMMNAFDQGGKSGFNAARGNDFKTFEQYYQEFAQQ
jgi:hypothetical protein